jgi:hypothetical protein
VSYIVADTILKENRWHSNPLGGIFTNEEDPEIKATYRRKKDGSYEPYFMPYSKLIKDNAGNVIGLTMSLDESDLDQQELILKNTGEKQSKRI